MFIDSLLSWQETIGSRRDPMIRNEPKRNDDTINVDQNTSFILQRITETKKNDHKIQTRF